MHIERQNQKHKKIIRTEQHQFWTNYCSELSDISKRSSVWKTAKSMLGKYSHKTISTIKHNNDIFLTNKEKAEAFGKLFSESSSNKNLTEDFIRRKIHCEKDGTK